jgi:hypothetical protein
VKWLELRIPPPVVALTFAGPMAVCAQALPMLSVLIPPHRVLAFAVALLGLGIDVEAVEARARTDERARILPGHLFLSETELVELTGYQRSKNQIQWLRERHWPFELASGGRPRVLRDAVIARLGGSATTSAAELERPKLRLPP